MRATPPLRDFYYQNVLDSRKFPTGMYILELVQDGKRIKSEKVIIQH